MTSPAPLRRSTPTPFVCDQRTVFIVVSGYPAVCAVAFFHEQRRVVAGTTLTAANLAPELPSRARCHRCRAWGLPSTMLDERLGWPWWCPRCVAIGVRRCLHRHARLPNHDEFWCPSCGMIRQQATESCPREADGRKRHVCIHCRRAQWKRRRGGH